MVENPAENRTYEIKEKSKIKKCGTCGADIAKNAKSCPQCGAKNKKPIFKKWWFWLIILVVISGIGGSLGNDSGNDNPQVPVGGNAADGAQGEADDAQGDDEASKEKAPVDDYEFIGDLTTEGDQFAVYIIGTVKNNKGHDLSYAQITFNLYDADGNQLGTALANINNWEKDGTWKFKAMGMNTDNQVKSYKLAEITGF